MKGSPVGISFLLSKISGRTRGATLLLKTLFAKNRAPWLRPKRDDGILAAFVARGLRKFRLSFGASPPATHASLGLGEAHLRKEFLTTDGEGKVFPTLHALQSFFLILHRHAPAAREAFSNLSGRVRRHTSSSRLSADACKPGLCPGTSELCSSAM
jgi:hypothetical protein